MSDAIEVKFGTPPPKPARGGFRRGPSKEWQQAADTLRANPGEWALLTLPKVKTNRQAHGVAVRIRKGSLAAFGPGGAFEAKVLGDDRNQVWARYVGDPEEEEASVETDAEAEEEDVEVVVEDEDGSEEEDSDEESDKERVVTF